MLVTCVCVKLNISVCRLSGQAGKGEKHMNVFKKEEAGGLVGRTLPMHWNFGAGGLNLNNTL